MKIGPDMEIQRHILILRWMTYISWIQVFKFKPRNTLLLAEISIDYIMIDSYLTVVTTTIQSVNKKYTNTNVNK